MKDKLKEIENKIDEDIKNLQKEIKTFDQSTVSPVLTEKLGASIALQKLRNFIIELKNEK